MRRFLISCGFLGAMLAGGAAVLAASDEGGSDEFRKVKMQVLDVRGRPAANVKVYLRGLERDAMGVNQSIFEENTKDQTEPDGWSFVTDSRGRFSARFGKFRSIEHEQETHETLPGWGSFFFVAMQPGTAGAVSPRIDNYSPDPKEWKPSKQRDEWSAGRTTPLLHETTRLSMGFKRGLRVRGRVIDGKGNPLPGVEFSVAHDLHVWSHTGHGGEIFGQETTSERDGRFHFERVYPARFDLHMLFGEDSNLYWEKTKVRSQWRNEMVEEITPRTGEVSIPVVVIAEQDVHFRYFGRVTDAAGRPVSGAKVAIGISSHRFLKTFEDDHRFLDAVTDENGEYEISAKTPYARYMLVRAEGFKDGVRDFDRGPVASPGKYDFSLATKVVAPEKKE